MQVLSYSNINKLKKFNAILLMELTMDYSDLDRLKYLNVILLTEFKKAIQKTHDLKTQHLNADQNSSVDHDENYESINNILTENKIQIAHIAKDLLLAEIKNSSPSLDNFEIEHIEDDQNLINDHEDMNHELIKCEICEKVFKTKILFKNHFGTDNGEYFTCNNFKKTFQIKMKSERAIKRVDEDCKDHNCRSCEKSFSGASDLKKHIKAIHEGCKDHICESCIK